ncbi:MAG: abortive infection system antitoxin AbiGi family protein [Campylobacterota bacterium]|nr:abortive infection system antitoxin AbiGi family protein [Campylobacterota bacterium]
MKPKTNTLFHFTKDMKVLKLILENGFWPKYCLEDIEWLDSGDHTHVAFPMVCFCDIPLSRINDHIEFYGKFGIGLTKDWGQENGINPLAYILPNKNLAKSFKELKTYANKLTNGNSDKKLAQNNIRYLYAHTKPLSGRMKVNGLPTRKEFYQESEWRYVPKDKTIDEYLKEEDFKDKDKLNLANSKTKVNCILKFTPNDIKYIFVESDLNISEIIDFIDSKMMGKHPKDQLNILKSKITSLESVTADI